MWSYLLALSVPVGAALAAAGGQTGWFLLGFALGVPMLDALIGREGGAARSRHRHTVLLYLPYVFISLWLLAIWVAGRSLHSAGLAHIALSSINVGLVGAFAAVHGHELMHRGSNGAHWFADLIFSMIGYGHYTTAHLLHHAHTGDMKFGSAAHKAQSLWAYLPASVANGLAEAWRVERERHGVNPGRNRVLRQGLMTLAGVTVFALLWGPRGVVLFAAQSIIAILLIETVGYIQHYGFIRASGTSTPEKLSWDGDFWLSNRLLINNPCHAEHHQRPAKVFSELLPTGQSLPAGYFVLLWMAMIPPLWFSIMDPKLEQIEVSKSGADRG